MVHLILTDQFWQASFPGVDDDVIYSRADSTHLSSRVSAQSILWIQQIASCKAELQSSAQTASKSFCWFRNKTYLRMSASFSLHRRIQETDLCKTAMSNPSRSYSLPLPTPMKKIAFIASATLVSTVWTIAKVNIKHQFINEQPYIDNSNSNDDNRYQGLLKLIDSATEVEEEEWL